MYENNIMNIRTMIQFISIFIRTTLFIMIVGINAKAEINLTSWETLGFETSGPVEPADPPLVFTVPDGGGGTVEVTIDVVVGGFGTAGSDGRENADFDTTDGDFSQLTLVGGVQEVFRQININTNGGAQEIVVTYDFTNFKATTFGAPTDGATWDTFIAFSEYYQDIDNGASIEVQGTTVSGGVADRALWTLFDSDRDNSAVGWNPGTGILDSGGLSAPTDHDPHYLRTSPTERLTQIKLIYRDNGQGNDVDLW